MDLSKLTSILYDDTTYVNRDDLVHALDVAWYHRMALADASTDEIVRTCFIHEAQVLASVLQVLRASEPYPGAQDLKRVFEKCDEESARYGLIDEALTLAREYMAFDEEKPISKTKRKAVRRVWNKLMKELDGAAGPE